MNLRADRREQGALVLALQKLPFRKWLKGLLDFGFASHVGNGWKGVEKDFLERRNLRVDLGNAAVTLYVDCAIKERLKYPSPLRFKRRQLRKIREVFANCADQAPVPGTSELNFITGQDAFRTNLRNDIGAVYRALANGEWKAATVLAGSAAEALLLWALKQRTTADITVAIQALKLRNELSSNPDPRDLGRWNLYDFIQVAEELHLI